MKTNQGVKGGGTIGELAADEMSGVMGGTKDGGPIESADDAGSVVTPVTTPASTTVPARPFTTKPPGAR